MRAAAALVLVLVLVLAFANSRPWCGNLRAQPAAPLDYQYRCGNEKIPAASAEEPLARAFSSEAARSYLDRGSDLWARQNKCVSCHTHGIYMAVRPALSAYWGKPPESTRAFVAAQAARLDDAEHYTASAPVQIAYIARALAAWDEAFTGVTSAETDAALRKTFSFQGKDGSIAAKDRWPPLNSTASHGTIMAAMAAAAAPGWLAEMEDNELRGKIGRLKDFLRNTPPKNDHENLLLLWASSRLPGLLDSHQKQELIEMLWKQQRPDGGWSTRTFATLETWGGGKKAELLVAEPDYANPSGDGYQTGLVVVVLRDAGIPAGDPRIAKAVTWLKSHQRESGRWWTRSLNTTSRFHYITYSGTAYAALALAKCGALDVSRE